MLQYNKANRTNSLAASLKCRSRNHLDFTMKNRHNTVKIIVLPAACAIVGLLDRLDIGALRAFDGFVLRLMPLMFVNK